MGSVSGTPYYSYLGTLFGAQNSTKPASTPTTPTSSSSTDNNAAIKNNANAVSTLLGNGANAFTPEVLSLLQSDSNGNFDPTASLLGGTSTNNGLTKLLSDLYTSSASAAVTQAKYDATGALTGSNAGNNTSTATTGAALIDNLLSSLSKASVAYNNTIQQNAKNAVQANSYGPDGITPLTA